MTFSHLTLRRYSGAQFAALYRNCNYPRRISWYGASKATSSISYTKYSSQIFPVPRTSLSPTRLINPRHGAISSTSISRSLKTVNSSNKLRQVHNPEIDKPLASMLGLESGNVKSGGSTTISPFFEGKGWQKELHAPKALLMNYYQSNYYQSQGATSYTTKKIGTTQCMMIDNEQWYTATVTDPQSQEVFPSGLACEPDVERHPSAGLFPPLHMVDAKIFEGKVYYRNGKLAEHAAAARAIDCYLIREGLDELSRNRFRLCYEEPYNSKEELASQKIDYDELLAKRNIAATNATKTPIPSFTPNFQKLTTLGSFLQNQERSLHVPKSLLQNYYQSQGVKSHTLNESYTTQYMTIDNKQWYTATFTDPQSQEVFPSGLACEPNVEEHPSASLRQPLYMVDAKIFEGKVYYGESKLAVHAAAARAIDCYLIREGLDERSRKRFRLCYEEPYNSKEEFASQRIDYDELLAKRNIAAASAAERPLPAFTGKLTTFKSYLEGRKKELCCLHTPKALLMNYYQSQSLIKCALQELFINQEQMIDGESWYTATFTDPQTQEQFSAGLACEPNVENRRGSSLYTPLHMADAKVHDGKVYYREVKHAEFAAAARAIDCYLLRDCLDERRRKRFRLCYEEPYNSREEFTSQRIDYDELLAKRSLIIDENPKPNTPTPCENEQISSSHGTSVGEPGKEALPEMTISHEHANSPAKVSSKLSTMARIAEVWTDNVSIGSSSGDSFTPNEYETSSQTTIAKIEGLYNWFERASQDINMGNAAFAQLCNKTLVALGQENGELDLDEEESHTNVEAKAQRLLDKIISSSKKTSSTLNTNTLNAYIRCLNRCESTRSAKSAEHLLKRMMYMDVLSGTDLPLPNVDTFNAVMSLWALVDGEEGRQGVNRIYSLLEDPLLHVFEEARIIPNHDTFKTLVAVNSKVQDEDGHTIFSFEQAEAWLNKVKTISSSFGDELTPDANFYQAALSAVESSSNKQHAKSWIRHGYQFKGGFNSADDHSNKEATAIAQLLIHAEENGVHPNESMYRTVIRAWTQLGTTESLLMAEDWAKRAIASSAPTQLGTFHPIIASWALCQHPQAPARVQEWIRQLAVLGESKPHLKADYDTLSAPIIAWRNVQAGVMKKLKEGKDTSSDENMESSSQLIFTAAQNNTQLLNEMFTGASEFLDSPTDATAFTRMFKHTIESWGCASQSSLLCSPSSVAFDASHGVNEMLKVAHLLDGKIEENDSKKEHTHHMLQLVGESSAEIVSQLNQIDSMMNSDEIVYYRQIVEGQAGNSSDACYFSQHIAEVEQMLRDFELHTQQHYSPVSITQESKDVRHRLYREIIKGCAELQSPMDHGHANRLSKFIMERLTWHNQQCNRIATSVQVDEEITDIYLDIAQITAISVDTPEERMDVLTEIFNNASPFFEHRYRKDKASKYATVDRARLIGSIRMAMGDSPSTEVFIHTLDDTPKKRARGNSALTYINEMRRKDRKKREAGRRRGRRL